MITVEIRELVAGNIGTIVATFDAHDPGIDDVGLHVCPCGWAGSATDWQAHLAGAIADALTTSVVELPALDGVLA